eukprot:16750_1
MEIDEEEKVENNGSCMVANEPDKIFYCRGINNVYGHGLDPLLFSTVKLSIKHLNNVKIINKINSNQNGYNSNAIMPFFKLYQRFISNVMIIGFIIAIQIKDKYTMYTLDDSTATVNCKLWNKESNKNINKWKIGAWVKIEGNINYFMNSIEINIKLIQQIIHPNEELMHWLECINIVKNVLNKPLKYHINPPKIILSNNAQMLFNLLCSNQITQFQFSKLLNHQFIKQCIFETVENENINDNCRNKVDEKQLQTKCLLKLRDIVRELRRLQKIKLIDVNRDIYFVNN